MMESEVVFTQNPFFIVNMLYYNIILIEGNINKFRLTRYYKSCLKYIDLKNPEKFLTLIFYIEKTINY